MFIYIIVLSLLFNPAPEKLKAWKEKKGKVVMEAEHTPVRNDLPLYWKSSKELQNYSGTGALQWTGASFIKDTYADLDEERILNYYFFIETEGVYYLKIKGICIDENESDVLARIDQSEWKNFSIANEGGLNWDSNSKKESYPFFFQQGFHVVQIASVTSGFFLDKIILLHESADEIKESQISTEPLDSYKESPSVYVKDPLLPNRIADDN